MENKFVKILMWESNFNDFEVNDHFLF